MLTSFGLEKFRISRFGRTYPNTHENAIEVLMGFVWAIYVATLVVAGAFKGTPCNSKHTTRAGSRIILSLSPLRNMVEVECPFCAETVELDYEEGAYVCPYCEDEFEWGPDEKRQVRFIVNENEEDSASLKWMIYFLTALTLILTIILLTEDTIKTCLLWIILVPYLIFY